MALIRLRIGAGWSEPLLVAHTKLLEISCCGSHLKLSSLFLQVFNLLQVAHTTLLGISCRGSYLKLSSLFLQVFKLLQLIKSMNATPAVKPFRESIILNGTSLSIVTRGPLNVTSVRKGSMINHL